MKSTKCDITVTPNKSAAPFTLEQLKERCAYWQHVLRLQDWDIEASIVRRQQMKNPNAVGECRISTYRQARIRLLDPIDFTESDWTPDRDLERTLVHELLHLPYDDCRIRENDSDGRWTPEWVALERGIELTAAALINLERRS